MTSVTRLLVGLVELGGEQLASRMRGLETRSISSSRAAGARPRRRRRRRPHLADVAVGALVALPAAGLGRAGSVARSPALRWVGSPARGGAQRLVTLLPFDLEALAERGREERREGRRLAQAFVREVTATSIHQVTQRAVAEVSQSPAIAELVREESATVAGDALLEVRDFGEKADNVIEGRVHSWLRRSPRRIVPTAARPDGGEPAG